MTDHSTIDRVPYQKAETHAIGQIVVQFFPTVWIESCSTTGAAYVHPFATSSHLSPVSERSKKAGTHPVGCVSSILGLSWT